jgi:FkbM family methyltransferase
MAKIFLDVGGYAGESSLAALDPRFGFDRVYCFEPVKSCYESIRQRIRNRRLIAFNFGLLDRTGDLKIHYAGSLGGSVYADAPDVGGGAERCSFVEASEFFREHIQAGDEVWMKLNCEGAECDILINLFETGEAHKLTEVLVDFDAQKIGSAKGKLLQAQALLKAAPFQYHTPDQVQFGMVNNYGGIRNWLVVTGAIEPRLANFVKSLFYQCRQAFTREATGYYKLRLLQMLHLRPPPIVPTRPGVLSHKRGK